MYRKRKKENIEEGIKIKNTLNVSSIYMIAIVIGVVVAKIISVYVVGVGSVSTLSMTPTVMKGDTIIINKYTKDYNRGDIVVFTPPNNKDSLYTKRIIGVGGDLVSITNGKVSVNGERIREGYVLYSDSFTMDKDIEVPKGEYFLLGDNRANSMDSRYWEEKTIEKADIKGKVIKIKSGLKE